MGQDTVATELVNCGANINQPNYHGNTPLHLAAASSSGVLCLELLINNGADVNMQVKSLYLKWTREDKHDSKSEQQFYWMIGTGKNVQFTAMVVYVILN